MTMNQKRKKRSRFDRNTWIFLLVLLLLTGGVTTATNGEEQSVRIDGPQKRWHRVTLTFSGPNSCETCDPNPFLAYRLNVTFEGPDGEKFVVPGFYAGDGDGGSSGEKWRARFAPPSAGVWTYTASFRRGTDVSTRLGADAGTGTSFDGASGRLTVEESDRKGRDFRSPEKGLLRNRGHHYLTFSSGEPWIKGGPNIPENFLARSFDVHGGRKGALSYIAERGANSIYFLPNNIGGDGNDTWPYVEKYTPDARAVRFDVGKLRTWEELFTHATSQGVFLHFQLAETEQGNETYHDDGTLGVERKLYYRELIARFGHHPGLEWDLGEENDYGTEKRRTFARFIKRLDPYDHPVTTHTHNGQDEAFYGPLLGNDDFDVTAFQGSWNRMKLAGVIGRWRRRSASAGVPWGVCLDEPQKIENDPDDGRTGYPHGRRNKMWPVYMSGGAGFEWYVQRDGGGHGLDQELEDFRQMKTALNWTGYARSFLRKLPVLEMSPNHSLGDTASGGNTYVLRKHGEVYALYNDRNGSDWKLDLSETDGTFQVRWFDPRNGGELRKGTVDRISGGNVRTLGSAPEATERDWAAIVRRVNDGSK